MVRSNGLGELRQVLNPAARRSKCWLGLPNEPATAPFSYLITSDHPPPSKVQREPLHDPAGYGTSVSAIDHEPHPASQIRPPLYFVSIRISYVVTNPTLSDPAVFGGYSHSVFPLMDDSSRECQWARLGALEEVVQALQC